MNNNVVEILQKLISIPSFLDNQKNEKELAEYIKSLFVKDGHFRVEEQLVENDRKNLIIHDATPPKIILFGHMDTVLPNNNTKNSFDGKIVGNKLFGLGAVDMKAGLAIMISSALRLKTPGLALVFTVDEEYDFKGAMKLIKKYQFNPLFIVCPESTDNEILNGCRGITEFALEIKGKSCHASRKSQGTNAIEQVFVFAQELDRQLKTWDLPEVKNSLNLAGIKGGCRLGNNSDGTPKIIETPNKVPDIATALFEIRIANPKMKKTDLEKIIKQITDSSNINLTSLKIKFFLGSMFTPASKLKSFEKAISSNKLPVKYKSPDQSGYYEAQLLQEKWGGNVVIFGPSPFIMSHSADEYVDIPSLLKVQEVIDTFLSTELNQKKPSEN